MASNRDQKRGGRRGLLSCPLLLVIMLAHAPFRAMAADGTVPTIRLSGATIVLPAASRTNCVELKAASELQSELAALSGSPPAPIIHESSALGQNSDQTRIYVGHTAELAKRVNQSVSLQPEEGVALADKLDLFVFGDDDGAPLCNNSKRVALSSCVLQQDCHAGSLHATNRLLHELGVRWLWPGDDGVVRPAANSSLALSAGFMQRSSPSVPFRRIRPNPLVNLPAGEIHGDVSWYDASIAARAQAEEAEWMVRQGLGGRKVPPWGQAFMTWWQKYGGAHPEFFALAADGSRGCEKLENCDDHTEWVKMDVSEPKLWEFIAAQLPNSSSTTNATVPLSVGDMAVDPGSGVGHLHAHEHGHEHGMGADAQAHAHGHAHHHHHAHAHHHHHHHHAHLHASFHAPSPVPRPPLGSLGVSACEDDENNGYCTCARCRALDPPERANSSSGQLSDRYAYFWNEVARAVNKRRGGRIDAWVSGYAYERYTDPPLKFKFDQPNVLVLSVGFGKYPATNDTIKTWRDGWGGWLAAGAGAMAMRPNSLWADYTGAGPMVFATQLAEDVSWCGGGAAVGAGGGNSVSGSSRGGGGGEGRMAAADFDSLVGNWQAVGPTYYVLARLLWRPEGEDSSDSSSTDRDSSDRVRSESTAVSALLSEYYDSYGDASAAMRAYFEFWQRWTTATFLSPAVLERIAQYQSNKSSPEYIGADRALYVMAGELYTPALVAQAEAMLGSARAALGGCAGNGTSVQQSACARVAKAATQLQYTRVFGAAANATAVVHPRAGSESTVPAAEIVAAGRALTAQARALQGAHVVNVVYTLAKANERGDLLGLLAAEDAPPAPASTPTSSTNANASAGASASGTLGPLWLLPTRGWRMRLDPTNIGTAQRWWLSTSQQLNLSAWSRAGVHSTVASTPPGAAWRKSHNGTTTGYAGLSWWSTLRDVGPLTGADGIYMKSMGEMVTGVRVWVGDKELGGCEGADECTKPISIPLPTAVAAAPAARAPSVKQIFTVAINATTDAAGLHCRIFAYVRPKSKSKSSSGSSRSLLSSVGKSTQSPTPSPTMACVRGGFGADANESCACGPGCDQCGLPRGRAESNYHISDLSCAINDPNGVFFDPRTNLTHVFYQDHLGEYHDPPDEPGHGMIVWGHVASRDLVHWARLPVALWNDADYDRHALITGSATVLPDGQIRIVYPGVCNCTRPTCSYGCEPGNNSSNSLNVAMPTDPQRDPLLLNWTKAPNNPVVRSFHDDPSTAWRTPYGEWRFTANSPGAKPSGTANSTSPIFASTDFVSWRLVGQQPGFVLGECVDFFPLPRLTPEAPPAPAAQPYKLPTHVHKSGHGGKDWYAVGTYVDGRPGQVGSFTATPGIARGLNETPIETKPGHSYAAKSMWDPIRRRRILFAWGRGSVLTLPREVTYHPVFELLVFSPLEEQALLRRPLLIPPQGQARAQAQAWAEGKNWTLEDGRPVLLASNATQTEVLVRFARPHAALGVGQRLVVGVAICAGNVTAGKLAAGVVGPSDSGVFVYFEFRRESSAGVSTSIGVKDLTKSDGNYSEGVEPMAFSQLSDEDSSIELRVFIDISVSPIAEVYYQGGRAVKTLVAKPAHKANATSPANVLLAAYHSQATISQAEAFGVGSAWVEPRALLR